jgi:hypothetical protein
MGIVKRQSLWNAAGGYLGVVIGAFNALFLMPWAFAQDPDGFGFVRWILSASLLVGAFAHVGFPHALVTFAPRLPADRRRDIFGAGLVSGMGVVLALGVLGIFWGDAWIQQAVGSGSFSWGWQPLWALVASYVVFELVASQAQSAYRVVAPQWIKDVGRKAVLTLASALLILDLLDFPAFLWAVTAGHALLTLVLVFYARKWIAVGWDWSGLPWRAFLAYAGFMVLTAGAQMAMGQLDVLLIGKRLNLAAVAQYAQARRQFEQADAQVGAGMRLGQAHGAGPATLVHRRQVGGFQRFAGVGIDGQAGAAAQHRVQGEAGVGRVEHLLDVHSEHLRHAHAAVLRVAGQAYPAALDIGGIGLAETGGRAHHTLGPLRALLVAKLDPWRRTCG